MSRTALGCWITTVVSAACRNCHARPEEIHVNPPARGETVFYCRECCVLCNSTKEGDTVRHTSEAPNRGE